MIWRCWLRITRAAELKAEEMRERAQARAHNAGRR